MALNLEGIDATNITLIAGAGIAYSRTAKNGSIHVGKPVMLSANGTVDLVTTGSQVFGKLVAVEPDGMASVQVDGFTELPTDGTAITYGGGLIGGAVAGTVKTGVSANAVVAVYSATAGFIYARLT